MGLVIRRAVAAVLGAAVLALVPTPLGDPGAPPPPLSSASQAKTVQRAIAEIAKLPTLPTLPALRVILDENLPAPGLPGMTALGLQQGSTIWLDPSLPYWKEVGIALHEIGHALHIVGRLDVDAVVAAMYRTPSVQALLSRTDDWALYAVQPVEMFARGFAQWVALRSGEPRLVEGVAAFGVGQWPTEEFRTVVPAFNSLFGLA